MSKGLLTTAVRSSRFAVAVSVVALLAASTSVPASADTPAPSPASGAPSSTASAIPAPQPSPSRSYGQDPSDFALMVSPARLVISPETLAEPQRVTVVNRGKATISVTVQKRNFTAQSDGSLNYAEDAPYAAASWVSVKPMSFELPPGTEQVVTARVEVPAEPDLGDHQVALIFVVPSGESEGNVRINRGVGLPAFITVPGPTDDSVTLEKLRAPAFATWGPVEVTASVRNTGTVHRDFRGTDALQLQGSGGGHPFPDFTVPRSASRDISTTWDPPMMCVCTLQLDLVNADGPPQTQTVRVVVFPWPIALGLLGVLLLVVLAVRLVRRSVQLKIAAAVAQQRQADYDQQNSSG